MAEELQTPKSWCYRFTRRRAVFPVSVLRFSAPQSLPGTIPQPSTPGRDAAETQMLKTLGQQGGDLICDKGESLEGQRGAHPLATCQVEGTWITRTLRGAGDSSLAPQPAPSPQKTNVSGPAGCCGLEDKILTWTRKPLTKRRLDQEKKSFCMVEALHSEWIWKPDESVFKSQL